MSSSNSINSQESKFQSPPFELIENSLPILENFTDTVNKLFLLETNVYICLSGIKEEYFLNRTFSPVQENEKKLFDELYKHVNLIMNIILLFKITKSEIS